MAAPTFELGLVMAGAVSAGSFTAGVLDYLFEALDKWYKAHNGNPPHHIKIKVMTGASAGGMCTGISALQFLDQPRYDNPKSNKLYNSWVKLVDIAPMLEDDDLKGGKAYSLLNSGIIDQIADRAFQFSPDFANVPPFVSDDLHLVLTVTNTRGVSYAVNFQGNPGSNPYVISNHGDFLHFAFRKPNAAPAPVSPLYGVPVVINSNTPDTDAWNLLKELCKATGAFPLGLRARRMKQPRKQLYGLRYPPHQPVNVPLQGDFKFVAIDGGVINNEPFTIGYDILMGGSNHQDEDARNSSRAIIMIDPFPSSPVTLDYDDSKDDIMSVAKAFFGSLRGQALFKPEDLSKAMNENNFNRFLIAPKRENPKGKDKEKYHVAGGAVGAFSGFVDETYREHDYQLGRRNAQHFFRTHFTLDQDNSLFTQWSGDFKRQIKEKYGQHLNANELPIIPLPDNLWTPIKEPDWPTISQKQFDKRIGKPIMQRVKAVGGTFISGGLFGRLWNWGAHKVISKKIADAFEKELKGAELVS